MGLEIMYIKNSLNIPDLSTDQNICMRLSGPQPTRCAAVHFWQILPFAGMTSHS